MTSIKIPLYNKNKEFIANAIISKTDEELISKYSLCAVIKPNTIYVRIFVGNKQMSLHSFLMNNTDENMVIDHIDNNGLNNTRENLRIVSKTINSHNRKKKENTSSKYIGVYFSKRQKMWIAGIRVNGKKNILGAFKNELDAAKAYDITSFQIYKEHANNNNLLSKEEIKKAIKENYVKLEPKKRELPKYISKNKNNKFEVNVRLKNKTLFSRKNTLEEAISILENFLKIKHKEKEDEEKRIMSLPIQKINNTPFILFKKHYNFYIAFVDEDIWHIINNMKWHLSTDEYAQTTINNQSIKMHTFIYNYKYNKRGAQKNPIDHKNGIKLDNRISNLHIISASQNAQNRKASKNSTSQYLGVYKRGDNNKYQALIRKDGQRYYLGNFECEKEAAKAYNQKALELYGNTAFINEIV